MNIEFVRSGAIYAVATMITGVANVVLLVICTRALAPGAYGVVEFITVLQVLIQIAFGLELTQGIARYYAVGDDLAERRSYASTGFWALLAAYGLASAIVFVGAEQLGQFLLGESSDPLILRVAALSVLLSLIFYVVRSQLRWELMPARYAFASVVAAGSILSLSAYLLLVVQTGLVGVFVASAVGYGLAAATCVFWLRHTYTRSLDWEKLHAMLRYSLPLTASSAAIFGASFGDRFIIRATLGFEDLGVYAAGARVASIIALASAGFQLGAAPLIFRNFQRAETPAALARILRVFLAVGLAGVVILAGVAPGVLLLLTTPTYAGGALVVAPLALATVLASAYVFLPGLSVRNMTSRFAAIGVTTAILSLALVTLLASAFGVVGAAAGVLGGAAASFALHAFFNQRVYPLPIKWAPIAFAILVAAACMVLINASSIDQGLWLPRSAIVLIGVTGVVALTLDSADRQMIRALVMRAIGARGPSINP